MKKERKHIRKLTRFTALLLIMAVSLTLFPVSGADTAAPAEAVSTEVLSLFCQSCENRINTYLDEM